MTSLGHHPNWAAGTGCRPGGWTGGYVADFVAQHAGKFGFVVEMSHDAPREVYVPAGNGKSIYHRRIHNLELVGQLIAVGDISHPLPLFWMNFCNASSW